MIHHNHTVRASHFNTATFEMRMNVLSRNSDRLSLAFRAA